MFEAIWQQVRQIPCGKVAAYGQVARAAGFPGAARQVGWALRAPSALTLPWHRVIGSGGRILLRGEAGFEQRMRLQAEGVKLTAGRVRMDLCGFFGRDSAKAQR